MGSVITSTPSRCDIPGTSTRCIQVGDSAVGDGIDRARGKSDVDLRAMAASLRPVDWLQERLQVEWIGGTGSLARRKVRPGRIFAFT